MVDAALFYTATRAKMIERLKMRDQALTAYALALSALLGFLIGKDDHAPSTIQLIATAGLPGICIIFSLIVLQHSEMVSALGAYLTVELLPDADPPHWDGSEARTLAKGTGRPMAQFLTLAAPLPYSLYAVAKAWALPSPVPVVATALTVATVSGYGYVGRLHWRSHRTRARFRDRLRSRFADARRGG